MTRRFYSLIFIFLQENNQDEEEYHRAKLLNNDSSSESDLEELAVASTSTHEVVPDTSLPTPLDIHVELADVDDEEEQSKQILLELSDGGEHEKVSSSDEETIPLRPSIRLQRISKADAELYMPPAWTNRKQCIDLHKEISFCLMFRKFNQIFLCQ